MSLRTSYEAALGGLSCGRYCLFDQDHGCTLKNVHSNCVISVPYPIIIGLNIIGYLYMHVPAEVPLHLSSTDVPNFLSGKHPATVPESRS